MKRRSLNPFQTIKKQRAMPRALLTLLVMASLAGVAQQAESAGLLIADGGFGGVLEIEEHAVEVTINNGIAVTEVSQVFRNTENRQVEALYTFPVPKGASVAGFSMWINGKEMIGEVVEKERARQIYNSYKQVRRDPGLLEQVDYKTFEMRIFPIAAGAEQRVRVVYYQELEVDDRWATYVYPLATVTRQGLDMRTRGRFAFNLDASSEVPMVGMESTSHKSDFVVVRHGEHYRQASLEATGMDLDRDLVVAYELARPRTGFDLVPSKVDGDDGYFLLTLTAGEELAERDLGMDYVFVLDISGSMDSDGKLAISRRSIGAFIDELGSSDRFEVLCFNVAATSLFDRMVSAEAGAKAEAMTFLESQRARGGTVLLPALETAYRYKDADTPLNVVILSDGMTEQRERAELHAAINRRPAGTRVFAIGVGNEVNRPLLEQITSDAGGLAAFISRGDDFSRQARSFRRKLTRPAASNVQLDFQGGEVYDLSPKTLPDLFHGSPLRLYGRYRDGGPVTIRFTADVGGEQIERFVDVDLPTDSLDNPEVERMWAWHRTQALLRQADRSDSRAEVVDEVIRLGEAFSIVTEYTSFLVLENDAEYQRWKIERRNALRSERDRRKMDRVRKKLEGLREQTHAELGPGAAAKSGSAQEQVRVDDATRPAVPSTAPRTQQPGSGQGRSRGLDFDLGGGGAIDPSTLALAGMLALLAAAEVVRRRGA